MTIQAHDWHRQAAIGYRPDHIAMAPAFKALNGMDRHDALQAVYDFLASLSISEETRDLLRETLEYIDHKHVDHEDAEIKAYDVETAATEFRKAVERGVA